MKEIKVTLTVYYSVEADSSEDAIEQARNLVAEELNGRASDWAKYEVIEAKCLNCEGEGSTNSWQREDGSVDYLMCEDCGGKGVINA